MAYCRKCKDEFKNILDIDSIRRHARCKFCVKQDRQRQIDMANRRILKRGQVIPTSHL